MSKLRRNRSEGGASLVEFAFIVPLLSMFLFGIVQFGIAYDAKQSINSAAREGARYAALRTSDVNGIVSRAQSSYLGAGSGTPIVRVYQPSVPAPGTLRSGTYQPCLAPTGNRIVAVEVEIPHTIDIPFWGRRTYTINARAEFQCE